MCNEKLGSNFDFNDTDASIKFNFFDILFSDNYYGIGIYSIPDITLLKANEKYLSLLDEPYNIKENCIGKHISGFTPGFKGSNFAEIWNTTIKTGKSYSIDEYMYEGFRAGKRYWKLSIVPICEYGKGKYCVVMKQDITEQVMHREKVEEQSKIIEEQKRHLEKALEMKDEFLSQISHEFRTPLNVISSAIQAMNKICGEELSEKAKKYMGMIKINTYRQLRLVNNLLDITRVNAGSVKINKKNIDIVFITKAIIESVQGYAAQKGIEISFETRLEKKVVGIDDEKYERILLNLLSNAIKFTPECRPIIVKLLHKTDYICIEVKDYGIGIPEDKKNIIFEKFGQVNSSLSRRAEGTGIGLSLVKKFAEALGGSVSVKSSVRKGSTFSVLLPDETVVEEMDKEDRADLLNNRLIQNSKIEFSDIYL